MHRDDLIILSLFTSDIKVMGEPRIDRSRILFDSIYHVSNDITNKIVYEFGLSFHSKPSHAIY